LKTGDGLALAIGLTSEVGANAFQADLGGCALRVDLTGKYACTHVVFDLAFGQARILRGSARTRLQHAFAIGSTADEDAVAFLAALEELALGVALALGAAVTVDAFLVFAVVFGAALDAGTFVTIRCDSCTLLIGLAVLVDDAPLVLARETANVVAVGIGADGVCWLIVRILAVAVACRAVIRRTRDRRTVGLSNGAFLGVGIAGIGCAIGGAHARRGADRANAGGARAGSAVLARGASTRGAARQIGSRADVRLVVALRGPGLR